MINTHRIKTFFHSNKKDSECIEECEKHLKYFYELLRDGRCEDVEIILEIKIYNYISPLSKEGFYSKALNELERIENYLEKIRTHSKFYKRYVEVCIFQRDLCLGRLKKYKESNIEFVNLLRKHPTNDNYIDWYKSNKKKNITRFFEATAAISFGIYLLILLMEFVNSELHIPLQIKGHTLSISLISIISHILLRKLLIRIK